MADLSPENIRYLIELDSTKAEANLQRVVSAIKKMSAEAKVSSKEMSESIKKAFVDMGTTDMSTAEFNKLINAAQRYVAAEERAAQAKQKRLDRRFEQQQERELRNIEKQARALDELNAKLRQGTASAKQFATALMGGEGSGAVRGRLSQGAIDTGKGIASGDVGRNAVNQVKMIMQEIQQITGLSTDRVKQIIKEMFSNIDMEALNRAQKEMQGLPLLMDKVKTAVQQVWNTIKGTLTAMAVFYATQPIIDFFTGAITVAKKARGELAQLNLAEAVLSKKGIDVTLQELDGFIEEIKKKYKGLVSDIDATAIVSEVASFGSEFGISKEETLQMSEAIAFMNLQLKMMGQDAVDSAHVLNAAMDARSNFFNGLGLNITDALVKEKAYSMGLAVEGEELDKVARSHAVIALLYEQTAGKRGELLQEMENNPIGRDILVGNLMEEGQKKVGESFLKIADAWNSLILEMSKSGDLETLLEHLITLLDDVAFLFGEVVKWYSSFVEIRAQNTWLADYLELVKTAVSILLSPFKVLATISTALGASVLGWVKGFQSFFAELEKNNGILVATVKLMEVLASWGGKGTKDISHIWGWGQQATHKDTQTASRGGSSGSGADKQEEADALKKWNDAIIDGELKFRQDMEELAIEYDRKLVDIATEYGRKRADAYKDYQDKVKDINVDSAEKIREIRLKQAEEAQETRNDDLEREREYQNKLLEMKEKFLMDLEEALHERDARTVLRLIKQYNLDKTQAARDKALDDEKAKADAQSRQAKFQAEMKEAQAEREQKLSEAKLHYDREIRDLNQKEKQEKDDLDLWRVRKQEDLRRELGDRLEKVLQNLIQEYNITDKMLTQIYALYAKYYGSIAQLATAAQMTMAGMQMSMIGGQMYSLQGGMGGYRPVYSSGKTGTAGLKTITENTGGMAEGGSILADRPTPVIFGEAGLEMATFTPIGRQGRDVNKIFSNLGNGMGGSSDGKVSIELLLSPDLEGRVVSNALNAAAEVIMRTQRSR